MIAMQPWNQGARDTSLPARRPGVVQGSSPELGLTQGLGLKSFGLILSGEKLPNKGYKNSEGL